MTKPIDARLIFALCLGGLLTGCGGAVNVTPAGAVSSAAHSAAVATFAISGTVYGAATANVVLTLNGPTIGSALSNATGAYSFTGLGPGTYTVSAAFPGRTFSAAQTVTVVGANSTNVNFQSAVTPSGHEIKITAVDPMPAATVGQPYSATVFQSVTGGRGTYIYQTGPSDTGTPPIGMVLGTDGSLTGTPTAAGTYDFEICATDTYGDISTPCAPVAIAVTGNSSPAGTYTIDLLAVDPLPPAIEGRPYAATVFLSVSGGRGAYSYHAGPSSTGTIPAGLLLNADGSLAGVPAAAGTYEFELCATDSYGDISAICATTSITVVGTAYDIAITAVDPMPTATLGQPYAAVAFKAVAGGRGTYTYQTGPAATGTPPPGMVLNADGLLAGAPTTAGTYNFEICASDSFGDVSTACAPTSIDVVGGSNPSGTSWVYYNGAFDWPGDYSFDLSPDYTDTTGGPLSGPYDIKITLESAWGGWLPYAKNWNFNSNGYTKLTFALKPTVANQAWNVYFVKVGDVPVGIYLNVLNYGPAPVPGQWATYTVPLSDLGVLGTSIYKFCIQDQTGLSSNTWYVDNVGFVP